MRQRWTWLAMLYTVFIVYGSVVPLDYTPLSVAVAWERFQHTPFFHLGLYARADWISNAVLFVPLAFLWCGVFGAPSLLNRSMTGLLIFGLCTCGAIGLEFLQLYFPTRTVSQNDIYAEIVGAAVGVLVWGSLGGYCIRLVHDLLYDLHTALRAFTVLYGIFYVTVALFPYDFVLSAAEFHQLLAHRPLASFMLGISCTEGLRCGLSLLLEILAVTPFGAAFAFFSVRQRGVRWRSLFWLGASSGAVLEVIQFFTYSGNVALVSLLTRGVGCVVGRALAEQYRTIPTSRMPGVVHVLARALVVPYLLLLMVGNHWALTAPLTVPEVIEKLQALPFIPFYFYYRSPEILALQALLYQTAMYLPFGLFLRIYMAHKPAIQRWWIVGLLSIVLATLMGVGRLFLDGVPDPTNVLIGGGTAVMGYTLGGHLAALFQQQSVRTVPAPAFPRMVSTETQDGHSQMLPQQPRTEALARFYAKQESRNEMIPHWQRILACVLLIILALWIRRYPWHSGYVGVSLAAYALVLRRYPWLWLLFVPAALPVLDFGTRTGWLVVDELDLLLLTTLIVQLWCMRLAIPHVMLGWGRIVLGLILMSGLVSTVLGLMVDAPQSIGSLLGYDGPLNTLRVAKACLWPVLFLPGLCALSRSEAHVTIQRFALGTGIGLLAASLAIWWERYLFTGLWNVDDVYRISGSFSSMHTGGASTDAYLAMSLPFLGCAFLGARPHWILPAIVVLIMACYAIIVTFTRTTYMAAVCGLGVLLVGFLVTRNSRAPLRRGMFACAACGVVALLASSPFIDGTAMKQRWLHTGSDAETRWAHWSHVMTLRHPDLMSLLFGEGLGRYPAMEFAAIPAHRRPGSAHLVSEDLNHFLRLSGGTPTYIDQRISLDPQERYWLFIDVRTTTTAARLAVSVCEKHLMNTGACSTHEVLVEPNGTWRQWNVALQLGAVGRPRPYLHFTPPLYLSLSTPQVGHMIDIDNIHLIDRSGHNLLTNGDFEHGGSLWYFTHDDHLVWHINNIWIALLFEHGFLGLGTFCLLVLYVCTRLLVDMWRGNQYTIILGASMLAFLIMGLTDSILDAPRPTIFVGLLCMLTLVATSPVRARHASSAEG